MRPVERNVQQQQVFRYAPQLNQTLTPQTLRKMTDPTAFKSKGKSFMQSLKKVGEITEQFSAINQIYEKENVEQAILDYTRGKEAQLPKKGLNLGKGYMRQYSMMQGEDAGRQFRQRYINEVKYNNGFVNTEDPEREMKKLWDTLYREHIGSLADNDLAMFGAAEQINQAANEGTLIAAHSAAEIFREDLITTFQQNQNGVIADVVSNGGSNEDIIRGIEGHFKAYGKEYPITRDNATIIGIDGVHKQLQTFLTPNEQGVIEEDNITKALQMLEVFETPTSNGVSWRDMKDSQGNYKFRKAIDSIQEGVLRQINDLEKTKNKLAEQASNEFVNSVIYSATIGEKDEIEAKRIVEQAVEQGVIDMDTATSTLNTLTDIGNAEPYVVRSNEMDMMFSTFSIRVSNGEVDPIEAYDTISTLLKNKAITKAEANSLIAQVANRRKLLEANPKVSSKFNLLKGQLDPEQNMLLMNFGTQKKFNAADARRIAAVYNTYWDSVLEGSSPDNAFDEALKVNEILIKAEENRSIPLSDINTEEGMTALELREGTDAYGKAVYKDKYGRTLSYEEVADAYIRIYEGE